MRAVLTEADRGVRFDDMAVLLRSPDIYTPLLEDAFRRANVPAYFENGTKRPDPAGRAFLALLDCAGGGDERLELRGVSVAVSGPSARWRTGSSSRNG